MRFMPHGRVHVLKIGYKTDSMFCYLQLLSHKCLSWKMFSYRRFVKMCANFYSVPYKFLHHEFPFKIKKKYSSDHIIKYPQIIVINAIYFKESRAGYFCLFSASLWCKWFPFPFAVGSKFLLSLIPTAVGWLAQSRLSDSNVRAKKTVANLSVCW